MRPILNKPLHKIVDIGGGRVTFEFPAEIAMKLPQEACGKLPWTMKVPLDFNEKYENYRLPKGLKEHAILLSNDLVSVLELKTGFKSIRKSPTGKFDTTSVARCIRDIKINRFSPENTRPFKTKKKTRPEAPSIILVVGMGARQRNEDKKYCERVAKLSMCIKWACEAMGCKFEFGLYSAIEKGYFNPDGVSSHFKLEYKGLYLDRVYVGTDLVYNDYMAMFDDYMYRLSVLLSHLSSPETASVFHHNISEFDGDIYHCSAKGLGVRWARMRGADLVICVGELADKSDADIYIPSTSSLEGSIKTIADKIADLKEVA